MSLISSSELADASRSQLQHWAGEVYDDWRYALPKNLTAKWFNALEAETLARAIAGGQGKGVRPWNLVDVTKGLDKEAIWIGVEYETGYQRTGEYQQAVNKFWNTYEHSCIDREGCGNHPVEFTFSPVNLSDFESDEYFMDDFIGWLDNKNIKQHRREDDDDWCADDEIGIHCNFSSPAIRNPDVDAYAVVDMVSEALENGSHDQKQEVFGRIPYGYLYSLSSNAGGYIEGKLFDSTDSLDVWLKYKKVIVRLAAFVDMLFSDMEAAEAESIDTDDLYEYLAGRMNMEDVDITYYEEEDDDDDEEESPDYSIKSSFWR